MRQQSRKVSFLKKSYLLVVEPLVKFRQGWGAAVFGFYPDFSSCASFPLVYQLEK